MQYMIERGHDGPARIGQLEIGEHSVRLPALLGTNHMPYLTCEYYVPGRDSPTDERLSFAAPTFLSNADKNRITWAQDGEPLLLPTMPAVSVLNQKAATILFEEQMDMLSKTNAESSILRIPGSLNCSDFENRIPQLSKLGVEAASFLFDGNLGPSTLNIFKLRSALPRNWITIAMGTVQPDMVPLLFYFGFDIFDISYAEYSATRNIRLWNTYDEDLSTPLHPIECHCTWCCKINKDEEFDVGTVLKHNVGVYMNRLSEALHFHSKGQLRWLVESSTHSRPALTALLRRSDSANYSFIEEFTPTVGTSPQPLIGPESYFAPAIRRYRERLAKRYLPPKDRKVILLLPCSARKPYSDSRSHRRFDRAIERALGSKRRNIAEVILSSPIGVVPRTLERLFPVKNYDIPVTGDWDSEEIEIAASALSSHLEKFSEDTTVVAHVSGGYKEVVMAAEDRIEQSLIYTVENGSATRKPALQSLEEVLMDLDEIHELKGGRPTLLEDTVSATLDFQFGSGAGELITSENASFRGRVYGNIVCELDGIQMCTFVSEMGVVSLTLEGGEKLMPLDRYHVQFDGEKLRGGSLFAIGISEADTDIRPGDEVLVVRRNGDLIAVGKSEMSGREMCDFNNGMGVNIRHSRG